MITLLVITLYSRFFTFLYDSILLLGKTISMLPPLPIVNMSTVQASTCSDSNFEFPSIKNEHITITRKCRSNEIFSNLFLIHSRRTGKTSQASFFCSFFEMAAMPFPCNGIFLIQGNLPRVLLVLISKSASCLIP